MTDTSAASTPTTVSVHVGDAPGTVSLALYDANLALTVANSGTAPVWAEDSEGKVLSLQATSDGLMASVKYVAQGKATVSVSLTDADGTHVLISPIEFTVTADDPVSGQLSFVPGAANTSPAGVGATNPTTAAPGTPVITAPTNPAPILPVVVTPPVVETTAVTPNATTWP